MVTAVQGMSLDDVSATSSVPVAYAVKLNGDADRSRLAVMFPWKLGYNPRSAPNLARYLTVFPHLSVLVGSGDGADVEVAFGAGVALADAIHLAWGMTRARDQFMFIGVDVKDIAQALK